MHAQDLYHADEDIEEVQLQRNTLIHHVLPRQAPLRQPRVMQHLLRVVQREASEHGQAAVEPDALGPHEGAGCRGGEDERGEPADGDEGDAGEKRSAEVEVFFLLGGRADEGERTHHGYGVEAGAGEEGGLEEEERGEDAGLDNVETGPKGVFLDVAT